MRLRSTIIIILTLALLTVGSLFLIDAIKSSSVETGPPAAPGGNGPAGEPAVSEPAGPEPLDCTVGLYTGRGSWDVDIEALHNFLEEYELTCVEIDEPTVSSANMKEICDILVFVGGWSAEYMHYIENHANIRSFVENGGCFVGFCAGAYYASSTMRWGDNTFEYPLGLFSGEAAGPLSLGWGSLSPVELNKGILFNESFLDTMEMWYFDGPRFTGFAADDVDVLARYSSNGEAAIIAFSFGQGRVLLSGPHPELGYVPSRELVQTEGGGGAQWPWLYAALQWLTGNEGNNPGQVSKR